MATRVFVVDDEVIIATTLTTILKQSGFEAEAFEDPLEALKAAEDNAPDILIADVIMPKINGVDLGAQFKAIHPKCKVLLFSGQLATMDILNGAEQKGSTSIYSQSPFTLEICLRR